MQSSLKNIFLADDDSDDVFMFEYVLNSLDIQSRLTVAYNGEELLGKLEHDKIVPDIIFLDINMPKLNGFETLVKIKEIKALSAVPAVMYSTCKNESDIAKAFNDGASSYFVKPTDINDLKGMLTEVLLFNWQEKL